MCAGSSFIPHLGQRSGFSLTTSGCIGQAKDGCALRAAHIHLGDERDRLVRRRGEIRLDALPLRDHVRVTPQNLVLLAQ